MPYNIPSEPVPYNDSSDFLKTQTFKIYNQNYIPTIKPCVSEHVPYKKPCDILNIHPFKIVNQNFIPNKPYGSEHVHFKNPCDILNTYPLKLPNQNSFPNHIGLIPNKSGIMFAHLNICSLLPKCLSLYTMLMQNNIDILSLNETWLQSLITNGCLFLDGYHIFRLDRQSHGGGVAILVANQYTACIENTLLEPHIELLHISLELPSTKPINIISIYR